MLSIYGATVAHLWTVRRAAHVFAACTTAICEPVDAAPTPLAQLCATRQRYCAAARDRHADDVGRTYLVVHPRSLSEAFQQEGVALVKTATGLKYAASNFSFTLPTLRAVAATEAQLHLMVVECVPYRMTVQAIRSIG